jgi:hypothetical protein
MVMRNQEKATSDLTSITELQSQLVTILLRVTSVIGLLAAILGTVDSLQAETDVVWPIGLYWGSYLIILVLNFWRSSDCCSLLGQLISWMRGSMGAPK